MLATMCPDIVFARLPVILTCGIVTALLGFILIKIEFHSHPLSVGSHAKKGIGYPMRVLISIVPSYTTAQPTGGYLAFLGRISPEKRPDLAIQLAQRSRIPLKITAKVDAVDLAYFETVIKPLLKDPLVDFIGEIGDEHKSEFLGNAVGLLFPINWPEPFGLVMIEAMSCGTPVIAWNCGSVS